jgi:hypothetical protein
VQIYWPVNRLSPKVVGIKNITDAANQNLSFCANVVMPLKDRFRLRKSNLFFFIWDLGYLRLKNKEKLTFRKHL